MIVRDATRDDLLSIGDVALVADPPDEGDEVDLSYYEHLLAHAELHVAETSGIVVGYAASMTVGPWRHITDLFLHPDVRGHGVGARLLGAVTPDSRPTLTFSSMHPAALPLYVRRGLVPRWPLFYLRGSAEVLPVSNLELVSIPAERAAELEAAWLGWDRGSTYTYWATASGSRVVAVLEAGEPVAVGAVGRRRQRDTLLHLSSCDQSQTPAAVFAVLASCGSDTLVSVPGENEVLGPLLDHGWTIVDQDVFCASEVDLVDQHRLIPHPGLL
jgi:GNAT superfamily N-acetyltransferase